MQRALLQYRRKENHALVHKALIAADRRDLIGYGRRCLVAPLKGEKDSNPVRDKKKR
jgi:hypothetical protein